MKTKSKSVEKTKYVFSKDNEVFMKENTQGEKEKWHPINFQWIPVVRLSNEFNKMSKAVLILFLSGLTILSSCTDDDNSRIFGSGNPTSELRDVASFTKVSSEGVFEVNIVQGETQSVEVTADDNVMRQVKTKVTNNELRLYLDGDRFNDISVIANITVPQLNGLNNSGIGNINAQNINVAGNMDIVNSGTAKITISGRAESLTVFNEGSGSFRGFDFMVNDATANNSGSGSIELFCNENLDATISGSGIIYFKGNPKVNVSISGSGQVVNGN